MEDATGQNQPLFTKERLEIHSLLANNPNYFGTVAGVDYPPVQPIKFNTSYEELTCVGLWPEKNLLEATIQVKLPFGFLGDLCKPGSYEYVRFFIDWNNDGDFTDFNEDLGVTSVNVHDIAQVKRHHLCYAVRKGFRPFLANCEDPYIVKLRAILSWEIVPPPGNPNFVPIWGNVLECWVQVDPFHGKIVGIVGAPAADAAAETSYKQKAPAPAAHQEKERVEFLELLQKNPNYFGTLAGSDLKAVNPIKYDTSYEELECIGLYPERNFLEAVLQVKRPYGFGGELCGPGTYEYVRFFIDWNGDGDFVDFNEDAGFSAVNVHDIPQVNQHRLCYALGRRFHALRANCQHPYIVKVRAILSWQVVPTGPNFVPVWGNVVECWVQIRPTERPPSLVGVITGPAQADPPACVDATPIVSCLIAGVTISGSAGGTGFASYRIEYRSFSSAVWIQSAVVYPDCSPATMTPDATTPVFAGPLAYLTGLEADQYHVRLTVNGVGGPIIAFTDFSMEESPVVIDKIGQVDARFISTHPVCPTEPFKLIKEGALPADPETSVGGSISIVGSAYFHGCGEEMTEWALQYQIAPLGVGPSPVGPPPPPPMVLPPFTPPPCETAGIYTDLQAPIPISQSDPVHPPTYSCWLNPNLPNYVKNGKLTRVWQNGMCLLFPPNIFHPVWFTDEQNWGTGGLNGRYTVRLRVRHHQVPMGPIQELYDAATVWLDNRNIDVKLTGLAVSMGADLDACGELKLSQFVGKTADIRGRAWDPLIVDTEPSWFKPNDNFDHYDLSFEKDGIGLWVTNNIVIPNNTQRVPNTLPVLPPAPNNEGVLATWDIVAALDGGVMPPGPYVPPPYPKLYRGERCAYLIQLFATDNTKVNDAATTHYGYDYWPFCIVNDL